MVPSGRIGNDIVTGMFAESYRFPEVPANLYDRPTLLMSLENSGAKKQHIESFLPREQFVLERRLRSYRLARTTRTPTWMAG